MELSSVTFSRSSRDCRNNDGNANIKMCQKDSSIITSCSSCNSASYSEHTSGTTGIHRMRTRSKRGNAIMINNNSRSRICSPLHHLFFVFALILICSSVGESHVSINEHGGYEDVVVSISKEVPPIACQQLIQNIQVGLLEFLLFIIYIYFLLCIPLLIALFCLRDCKICMFNLHSLLCSFYILLVTVIIS